MDQISFQRAGLLDLVRRRRGDGSREAGGESNSGGIELLGPPSSTSSDSCNFFAVSSSLTGEGFMASMKFAADWMDRPTCSSLISSSPPIISSRKANQVWGRRTSIFLQSHGLAASYQAWFTKQRLERVLRASTSGHCEGGWDEGRAVGASEDDTMTGSSEGTAAGTPA